MGCKASKNLNSQPPIEYNFAPTTRPELDSFFQNAADPLRKIESLRQKIYSTKKKGVEIAGTANSLDSPYTKAVQVLFWALSSAKKGQIAEARVSLTEQQPPFGSLNTLDYCKDTLDLFKTLQEYLTILSETSETLQILVSQIQRLKDEQLEIKKSIDPTTVTAKTSKTIDTNMKKLTESITTSAKVLSQVPDEQQNALELIRYIQGFMQNVDEVGRKTYAAGLIKPIDIYKWTENERKKGQTKYVSPDASNKNTTRIDENGNHGQKTELDLGNGSERSTGNQLIQPESIPIGHSSSNHKSQENLKQDPNQKNNLNTNFGLDPHNESPSFGEINPNSTHSQANGKTSQPKFNPKQDNYVQLNDTAVIYNHMQPKSNESVEEKKIIFGGTEESVEKPKIDDKGKVDGGGWLSPGGSKQAGILQGDENIIDAEEKRHPLAQESTSILGFAEKARQYLDSKN